MVKIEKLSSQQAEEKGISTWPIWEKEISRFDWYYEETEECLLLEGRVTVETSEGNYTFGSGDFVTFQKGLRCVWDIQEPVKKHYNFKQ